MKFQKLSLLSLALIMLSLSSCSSDDSSKSDEKTDPVVVAPVEEKLVSITYPRSEKMAYSVDDEQFKYDDQKRVNFIGYYLSVSYVNDELIETKTTGDDITNADLEEKTSIKLKNKNITSIIANRTYKKLTGETSSVYRDSSVFSYENEYLSKIVTYAKLSVNGDGIYRLKRQLDFKVTAGNITQVKTTDTDKVVITNYTYDNTPNVLMGDFAYDTPVSLVRGYYILTHDKLGKRNANNIIAMENVYTEAPLQISYEKLTYKRVLDKSGRISEIWLSGNSITSNQAYYPLTNFTDQKVVFQYK